jgi:hypothetical protein
MTKDRLEEIAARLSWPVEELKREGVDRADIRKAVAKLLEKRRGVKSMNDGPALAEIKQRYAKTLNASRASDEVAAERNQEAADAGAFTRLPRKFSKERHLSRYHAQINELNHRLASLRRADWPTYTDRIKRSGDYWVLMDLVKGSLAMVSRNDIDRAKILDRAEFHANRITSRKGGLKKTIDLLEDILRDLRSLQNHTT